MKKIYLAVFVLIISQINAQNLSEEDKKMSLLLLEKYTEAKNKKDYTILKPYIHEKCIPNGDFLKLIINESHESESEAYKKGAVSISDIKLSILKKSDTIVANFIQQYANGFTDTANFLILKENTIQRFINVNMGTNYGPIITSSTSYVKFNVGLRESIKMKRYAKKHGSLEGYEYNFDKIKMSDAIELDISQYNTASGFSHTVYYEKKNMKEAALYCLNSLKIIDSLVKVYTGINTNFPIHDFLIKSPGKKTYTISNKRIWYRELSSPLNFKQDTAFIKGFLWLLSHEITEDLLVSNNIKNEDTRWYRDGMAEYISYRIMNEISPAIAKRHLEGRKSEIALQGKRGPLLEWGGSGEISNENDTDENFAKNVGADKISNYGRAMLFFIDYYEKYGNNKISVIHTELFSKNASVISSEMLIEVMDKVTGSNVKTMIMNY